MKYIVPEFISIRGSIISVSEIVLIENASVKNSLLVTMKGNQSDLIFTFESVDIRDEKKARLEVLLCESFVMGEMDLLDDGE